MKSCLSILEADDCGWAISLWYTDDGLLGFNKNAGERRRGVMGMKVELTFRAEAPDRDWKSIEQRLWNGVAAKESGFGWVDLPLRDLVEIKAFGAALRDFGTILVIGIGGSALGLETALKALRPEGDGGPAVLIADNLDARRNEELLARLDFERTAILVVSKSGRTLETLGNLTFFLGAMEDRLGERAMDGHLFLVTDPESGLLRDWVNRFDLPSLELPGDVGGRYSVLSSAALPAMAAAGLDVDDLLAGAGAMRRALAAGGQATSAARALADSLLEGWDAGRNVTVFMPYGSKLGALGPWFAQLWGESLGKNGQGLTPQAVLGTVDQHSQLQLYACGPDDKFYFFLSRRDEAVPRFRLRDHWELPVGFLDGLTLDGAMNNELCGVIASLRGRGRPCAHFVFDTFGARELGEAFFFFEWLTALVGLGRGINPFDQPGVEEGKNYALALCGSPQWEHLKEKALELNSPVESFDLKDL